MTPAYVPAALRRQVRADAGARCGYCHSSEAFLGMPLDIEHLVPEAAGGGTVRENLWLACSRCNDFKGDRTAAVDPRTGGQVPLFNPRTQVWTEHSPGRRMARRSSGSPRSGAPASKPCG